jgi:hypothetical protein
MGSISAKSHAPAPTRARWVGVLIGGLIVAAGVVAFFSGSPGDQQLAGSPTTAATGSTGPETATSTLPTEHDMDHDTDHDERGPPPEQTLVFTGDEYAFDGPTEAPAARTRIEFRNIGDELHEISLARLAPGTEAPSSLAEMDRLWADAQFGGANAPVMVAGSHEIDPGETTHLDVDLTSGTYLVSCPFPDPATSEYHFSKGMIQVLVVT